MQKMSKINQYIQNMTLMIIIARFDTNNKHATDILHYDSTQVGHTIHVFQFQKCLKRLKLILGLLIAQEHFLSRCNYMITLCSVLAPLMRQTP